MEKVTVMINEKTVNLIPEKIPKGKLSWRPATQDPWPDEIKVYRFNAGFNAEAVMTIEVTFRLPAGYDNRVADLGMSPTEAAHALNWGKGSEHVSWYVYNLESANTFKGGLGNLELEILVPENSGLDVNVPFTKKETARGVVKYSGAFSGIPAPYIEAKVKHTVSYNMIGGTFAIGLVTNYIDYAQFTLQALFDFFFYNHQFSAGIEGNPSGSSFRIPVIYTFIPGGKMNSYTVFGVDVRFSFGALFDILPSSNTGFRAAAGIRAALTVLEISYDFYPFDNVKRYAGRMSFLYKLSI
jgi:hypothetical protein